MTEAEAIKAYKEMLPCETTVADMQNWEKRKLGYPIHLVYKGPGALLSRVFLVFQTGANSTSEYPIEKLELTRNAE